MGVAGKHARAHVAGWLVVLNNDYRKKITFVQ
jgi:hypothetical protein